MKTAIPELEKEVAYFEENREDLLKKAPEKFALIKGSNCLGFFDNEENAYEEGTTLFPGEPFLIQQILPEDIIAENPAYFTGAMYASF
jgi:hypothetical protein